MKSIKFNTVKTFTDITPDIRKIVPEGFNGLVHVFSKHTTSAIKILEDEILLKADYMNFLEEVAPEDAHYQHNHIGIRDVPPEERINGHSHIRALFFPTSEMIPVADGKLVLGKWQTLFLVELDPTREREVVITFISEV